MFLTKKSKCPKQVNLQNNVAKVIAAFLLSRQVRLTSFMNKRVNRLGKGSKCFSLFTFCFLFGGFSFYSLISTFSKSGTPGNRLELLHLQVPKYYEQGIPGIKEPQFHLKGLLRLHQFKSFMDSLKRSPGGKALYESIIQERPGMLDSIKQLDETYYLQLK